MEMKPYIVYIKLDDENRITSVNSSAFLRETDSWTEIDSGYGDKYHHAQGNYFQKPIMDERGIKRYQSAPNGDRPDRKTIVEYVKDGVTYAIYERTQEEMDAEYVEPVKEQDTEELLLEMAADHEYRLCLIELGVNDNDL